MVKGFFAFVCGLIFGLGLTISQMVNPTKVLAFLDIFNDWDPSLGFVMGSALLITATGYRLTRRQPRPIFDVHFHMPNKRRIDKNLIIGAVLFGSGWGIVGFCPGPAIAALSIGGPKTLAFLGAMAVGMIISAIRQSRTAT